MHCKNFGLRLACLTVNKKFRQALIMASFIRWAQNHRRKCDFNLRMENWYLPIFVTLLRKWFRITMFFNVYFFIYLAIAKVPARRQFTKIFINVYIYPTLLLYRYFLFDITTLVVKGRRFYRAPGPLCYGGWQRWDSSPCLNCQSSGP